jgi:hypothetical protein
VLIEAGIVVAMTHFRHKVSWGPELLRGRDTYIRITHTYMCVGVGDHK